MNRKYLLGIIILLGIFILFKCTDKKEPYQDVPENEINESLTKKTNEKANLDTQDLIIFVPNDTFTGLEERPITLSNPDGKSTIELLIEALTEGGKTKAEYNKPIPSYIKIKKAYKKGKTVFIDIDSKSIKSDSARESIVIDSLILTMTTLEGVDNIRILMNGQNTKKFMGTFDVSETLDLNDVTNNVFYLDYLKEKSKEKPKESKETEKIEKEEVEEAEEESDINDQEVVNSETTEQNNEEAEEEENTEELIPSEPIPMSIGNN